MTILPMRRARQHEQEQKKAEVMWGRPLRHREHHHSLAALKQLRGMGDEEGDEFLEVLLAKHPELLGCGQERVRELVAEALQSSKCAETDSVFLTKLTLLPAWVDREALCRGQRVYLKHSLSSHLALLYSSLIGGFSAPAIISTLDQTGYLTRQSGDLVWRRLLETFDMILKCLSRDDALDHGGVGWIAVIAVRLLHSRVRRRVGSHSIHQEHLLVTLLSFSINVLDVIHQIEGPRSLSRQECCDYLHLWKVIGHLIGVSAVHLQLLDAPETARGAFESLVCALLVPNVRSSEIANNIISSVAHRPPLHWTRPFHCALARKLLLDPLADALALPKTSFVMRVKVELLFLVIWLLNKITPFGEKTMAAKRRIMQSVVSNQLASLSSSAASTAADGVGGCPFVSSSSSSSSSTRAGRKMRPGVAFLLITLALSTARVSGWRLSPRIKSVGGAVAAAVLAVADPSLVLTSFPPPAHAVSAAVAAVSDLTAEERRTIALFQASTASVVFINTYAEGLDVNMNVLTVPTGTGSGFFWDVQGHVVTNYHVIKDAKRAKVSVTLTDGRWKTFDAKVVGTDPDKDVAVLSLDLQGLPVLPVKPGTSSNLRVGQSVFAIGNPFGLDHSLSTGVVSGLGREVRSPTGRIISNIVQTDAAINPGNSGGPLLDSGGRLVGMNTAIFSTSGSSSGVGFALPIDTLSLIVDALLKDGYVDRPIIGISYLPARQVLGIDGCLVLTVPPGTNAEASGLRGTVRLPTGEVKLGDVIIGVDDEAIVTETDLFKALEKKSVGDVVDILVTRGIPERGASPIAATRVKVKLSSSVAAASRAASR